MFKWIAAIGVAVWMGQGGLAGFDLQQLMAYRDYFMAVGIALVMAPWFVGHLDG